MKKVFLVGFAVLLLAAGCNSQSQQSSNNPSPTTSQTINNPAPTPTATSTPKTGLTGQSNSAYLQTLVSKVTNWSAYKPLADGSQFVGSDPCDGETDAQIKAMDAYMAKVYKDVNVKGTIIDDQIIKLGAYYTPNYQHWSAREFVSFKGGCGAGGRVTLYAYPDKVIWLDSCWTGGVAPDNDVPNRQAIIDEKNKAADKCQRDEDLLVQYFQSLAKK